MNPAILIFSLFLVILILSFFTIKGKRRKIILKNSDDSEIILIAEIANNVFTRMKGLMGRKELKENEGMLFVFDKSGIYSFWMLHTYLSLDLIFINENFEVVEIAQMDPHTLDSYKPKTKAKYILEVNQGFSKDHLIRPGKTILKM